MRSEIELGPDEAVPGRPFTDPAHTDSDETALRKLLGLQRVRAERWVGDSTQTRALTVRDLDEGGFRHLLVVPDPQALLTAESPTVVGFFGRPRADADVALLFELEEELVAAMPQAEELLSYYDVELVKGAFGNLILFATTDGPRKWRENPIHTRAVEVSPGSYHEIRLHQGELDGALLDGGELRITRTRYLDFSDEPPWYAVRPR